MAAKPTFVVTAADVKDGWYVGATSLDGFDGNLEIEAELGYVRFKGQVSVTGFIWAKAGSGIKAGAGIKAGEGIEAGWGIEAGEGIEAGWGIEAGLSITCKRTLTFRFRLFAGTCTWKLANDTERTVTCGEHVGDGEIAYGILVETAPGRKVPS